jgi:hypothetical protein
MFFFVLLVVALNVIYIVFITIRTLKRKRRGKEKKKSAEAIFNEKKEITKLFIKKFMNKLNEKPASTHQYNAMTY